MTPRSLAGPSLGGANGANLVGMVVPKGQAARLAHISEFIEQAKASGLVQQASVSVGR